MNSLIIPSGQPLDLPRLRKKDSVCLSSFGRLRHSGLVGKRGCVMSVSKNGVAIGVLWDEAKPTLWVHRNDLQIADSANAVHPQASETAERSANT